MARHLVVHPENPQSRLLRAAVEALHAGEVVVYPTVSCYALACLPGAREAQKRIRRLRGLSDRHPFTYVCADLATVGQHARMDNYQYRLIRSNLSGAYTFILRASFDVPKHLQDARRNVIGVRIPDHPVAAALLQELDGPLVSTTLKLPGDDTPMGDPEEILERIGHAVDLLIDAGHSLAEPSTVIDLTRQPAELVRAGRGDPAPFGIDLAD